MKNQYRFFEEENFEDLKHRIFNVLRLRTGDTFSLVSKGKEYICQLTKDNYKIIEEITVDREPKINLTLAIANLKKDKLEYVLQKATEVGVNNFLIFNGENSVKITDSSSFKKSFDRYKKIIREACEQSLRLYEPKIEWVEFEKINWASYDTIFITDPIGAPLNQVLGTNKCQNSLLLIGPEGGFSQKEFEFVKEKGGTLISFGKRILRSETAAMVISANIINYFEK